MENNVIYSRFLVIHNNVISECPLGIQCRYFIVFYDEKYMPVCICAYVMHYVGLIKEIVCKYTTQSIR